jgi:hypothetical protein
VLAYGPAVAAADRAGDLGAGRVSAGIESHQPSGIGCGQFVVLEEACYRDAEGAVPVDQRVVEIEEQQWHVSSEHQARDRGKAISRSGPRWSAR